MGMVSSHADQARISCGGAFGIRLLVDPTENIPISGIVFYLFKQCGLVNAREDKELLIHRVSEFVVASLALKRGAGLVKDPRQHGVSAETDTRAARRTLGESMEEMCRGSLMFFVRLSMLWWHD
jgi:hypothetical protein